MQICGRGIVSVVTKVFSGLKMWSNLTCLMFNEWYPLNTSRQTLIADFITFPG